MEVVEDREFADVIFVVEDIDEMFKVYNKEDVFVYLSVHDKVSNFPSNVVILEALGNIQQKATEISRMKTLVDVARLKKAEPKKPVSLPTDVVKTKGRYRVLVIDDKEENLELARHLLSDDHDLATACGFQQGMKALHDKEFDAVLCDMEMPANKYYPSYSFTHAQLGKDELYGFGAMFEVTEKGKPFAIVTDGNHHASWVSAMFDRRKTANVNGQTVLFFNNIGKRWDVALKALMES